MIPKGIVGDIVEAGVGDGANAIRLLAELRPDEKLWVYDTFAGFPIETIVEDDGLDKSLARGIGSPCNGDVKKMLEAAGVVCIEGLVPDCMVRLPEKVRYAHIDCDTYYGNKGAWDRVKEKVVPGGAVAVHDIWYGGPKKAIEEMQQEPGWTYTEEYYGYGYFTRNG